MKKLSLIIIVIISTSLGLRAQTERWVTLNGIKQNDARDMMDHFKRHKDDDKVPMPTSVWFSKKYIHSIVKLLEHEGADGLRFYCISKTSTTTPPLKNLFAVFSTKVDNTTAPDDPQKSMHRDYYYHSAKFLNYGRRGTVSYGVKVPGALLFKDGPPCPAPTPGNKCYFEPNHFVSCEDANKWVKNYSNGSINTFSEWFDLQLFKDYDLGLKNDPHKLDGLRIYFAKTDNSKAAKNPNRHIFIIVPTTKMGISNHLDYYGCIVTTQHIDDKGELCPDKCN